MPRVLDKMLPARCAGCGAGGGWPMCGRCAHSTVVVTPPWCRRCGRPGEEPAASCADCPPPPIDLARSPFVYTGPIAAAIRGMKFSGWHDLARPLAGAMAEVAGGLRADVVTWVPLSRRRLARRGFDQAELLALALAERLELPACAALERRSETRAQARRSGVERRRALEGAFRVRQPVGGTTLLVDDVLTTGSTAAACADALRAAGAGRVAVVTAARSIGGPVPDRCRGGGWNARG